MAMPSSSSNLPSPSNASSLCSPEEGALEDRAVKTFAFDATAGRSARPEDAELPVQTVPKPKYLQHLPLVDWFQRTNWFQRNAELPPNVQPLPPAVDEAYETLPVATEQAADDHQNPWQFDPWQFDPLSVRPWRRRRRKSAWWTVSLVVHAVIILGLSLPTLVVMRQQESLDLDSSSNVFEEFEALQDLEIELAEQLDTEFVSELLDPEVATFTELSGEESLQGDLVSSDMVPFVNEASLAEDGTLAELSQLFGADGNGMADLETGVGGAAVSFFGTKVEARRILFILDNSGGMRHGGKFEALLSELRKSVDALKAQQEFYVIFYSDTVYPLYYPESAQRFVAATDENREQLGRWLDSVEFCTGNAIDEALAATAVIRPDVVFLLTDGNLFTTEKKKAMLLDRGERPYPIHTFGLGVSKNSKVAAGLLEVAEVNGGTFRAIRVSDADRNLAEQKQRPYHNRQPGAVWGIKVGARRW